MTEKSVLFDRISPALAQRYRMVREIGSGAMAIVFEAHDLRHDRDVAIKVLRPEIGSAVGSQRFLQEIRIAAKLFHPHILMLLDSGEADGLLYYVMPLVNGESLRHRLDRERMLQIPTAVQAARECADALAFAHSQGVIHRDIKPENVLFEAGHAVISDFGIARALSAAGGERLTNAGIALGTPGYMSPEQASGESNVDARADVYALACVLFEMLAGRGPFEGGSAATIMARHVTEPAPEVMQFRPEVSPHISRALAKALAKDPDHRFATAEEFAQELEADRSAGIERPRMRNLIAAGAAVVLVLLSLTYYAGSRRNENRDSTGGSGLASGLERKLEQITFAEGVEQWPAWAPDGTRIGYVGEVDGHRKLFVHPVSSGDEQQLTRGPYDDIQPTWSADGQRMAFVRGRTATTRLEPSDVNGTFQEGGDIWTIDVSSGKETRIVEDAFDPAYSPDGKRLAFDAAWAGTRRIWISDAEGRNPRQVTSDSSEAVVHAEPSWSPDGMRLVFRRTEKTASDIVVVDLATQKVAWITRDNVLDMNPAWSPDGKSVYYVSAGGGGLNLWRATARADGEREGPPHQLTTGAGDDINPAPSPHGNALAFSVRAFDSDIWRLPVDPSTGRPTGEPGAVSATTRVESRGSWSPDGSALAFNSDRRGEMNIWLRDLASGAERQLTTGAGGDYQPNWSPDERSIVFFSARSGNTDIWLVKTRGGELKRLTSDRGMDTNPFHSPDGKRIAFMSDRRGRLEVWVMNADGSGQQPVTEIRAGGHFIRWSKDGESVIFRAESATQIQAVQVRVGDGTVTQLRDVTSGAHMSWSPRHDLIMDVRGHKALWVYPLSGAPYKVFEFPDPHVRVDYPVWSPDGKWVLFDRAAARGGDIWTLR